MSFERQVSNELVFEDLTVLPQDCVRRALLIATGRHSRAKMGRLPGASADVNLIRELLENPCCGFKKEDVVVLDADDEKTDCPTKENITETIDAFLSSCGANDLVFLYFIGHGFYKYDIDYYVPFDVKTINKSGDDVSYSSDECFSLKSLREKLNDCKAKYKWVVVDACRVKLNRDRFGRVYEEDQKSNGELKDVGGTLWFQSCGINQKSYEIQVEDNGKVAEHGLFTWYFYKGVSEEADKAGDRFGRISPKSLFDYTRERVIEYCKKESVRTQIPLSSPNHSDYQFVFAGSNAEIAHKKAHNFFANFMYVEAYEEIKKALEIDSDNKEYKKLETEIKRNLPSKGTQQNEPVISPKALPIDYFDPNGKEYRLIKAGSFWMGSPLTGKEVVAKYTTSNNPQWYDDASRHYVTLTRDFYLAKYPVTRREFQQFVDATGYKTTSETEGTSWTFSKSGIWKEVKGANWKNPGFKQTNEDPVVCVSYLDALEYIRWLNKTLNPQLGLNGSYRLPTEAEWEYACRAGTETEFFWGDEEIDGEGYLNGSGTEGAPNGKEWSYYFPFKTGYLATSPVGSFRSNPWGLYDMLGNVWEWVADWYGDYPTGAITNPDGPINGSVRVLRGGGWFGNPADCRCAYRAIGAPEEGVRALRFSRCL